MMCKIDRAKSSAMIGELYSSVIILTFSFIDNLLINHCPKFIDFFEDDPKAPLKKNILASNSNIHEELKELINKKDIE